MKYLTVREARARFGEILDDAEKGATVVIERRSVRFRLVAESRPQPKKRRRALFDVVDAAVDAGQWSWKSGAKGLTFTARRKP